MDAKIFPRNEIFEKVKKNLNHADVKAYLDRSDPRHSQIVDEVTALVEECFGGQSQPHPGLMESAEGNIRQALYDDARSVDDQIRDILNSQDEKWSKAYFDGSHPLHREAVQRMTILGEAKFNNAPYQKEIMPIITRTGAGNMRQADVIDHDFKNNTTTEVE